VDQQHRRLEGPGHEERLESLQDQFRALNHREIAAIKRERISWLHRKSRRNPENGAAVPANVAPVAKPESALPFTFLVAGVVLVSAIGALFLIPA
jgi:hypothetical protein